MINMIDEKKRKQILRFKFKRSGANDFKMDNIPDGYLGSESQRLFGCVIIVGSLCTFRVGVTLTNEGR